MHVSVITGKKLKKLFLWVMVICLALSVVLFLNKVSYPLIIELCEIQSDNYVTNAVNEAAKNIMALRAFYDDFYTYERNGEGEIVLVKANTASINQLIALARIELQEELNKLENQKIDLHLGAFTGSSLLADNGPVLTINIIPIGNAVTTIESYYYAQGINQTIHRLILRVTADVRIIVPLKAKDCKIVKDIILAEDIILGRIPGTYINTLEGSSISENIFDLMP